MSEPVLVCDKVKKSYVIPGETGAAGRLEVLKGIDFEVRAGETLAIMGRSGGGKSTLLSCISGLDVIDSGEIRLMGKNLSSMDANSLNAFRASRIGIVFQQFQLLDHFTALENVRLPLDLAGVDPLKADQVAREKLERVGLAGRESHFPDRKGRRFTIRSRISFLEMSRGKPLIEPDTSTTKIYSLGGMASGATFLGGCAMARKNFSSLCSYKRIPDCIWLPCKE